MEFHVSSDPAGAAAASIVRRLRYALRVRARATLALSGGSTAPALIDALAAVDVPWDRVTIAQVDERVAPDGDPARNASQLSPLHAAGAVVLEMPVTDPDRRSAARRYTVGLPEMFDVVHLGIGDDGHTASWPPGEESVWESQHAVELVGRFHGRDRMTLTALVINGARSRVVLATGAAKRTVIERWLLRDMTLPISHVRRGRTSVFLDHDAAPPPNPNDM